MQKMKREKDKKNLEIFKEKNELAQKLQKVELEMK